MNDHLKNLKLDPAYSLSASERQAMRASLERLTAASMLARPASDPSWLAYLLRPAPIGAFALLVAVSTSSVSLAAGGALPGDLLYGVKRSVNERLQIALAPTTEARAVAHVRQAEERLEEVEVLAAQSALTPEIAEATAASVAVQIATAERAASDLSIEGDAAAAASVQNRIEVALLAHAELLDAHAKNFDGEARETLEALAIVAREGAEAGSAGRPSEGERLVLQEASRTRAKERLASLAANIEDADLPRETREALMAEHAELASRFDNADLSVGLDGEAVQASYDEIDRLAYRALTILESASRIAKESSKEVVVELASASAAPQAASAPVALRAKSAEPEATATLMMTMEATTSEAGEATADLAAEAASAPAWPIRFELRERIEP